MKRPDMNEEIQAYVDLLVAEKVKAGMSLDDARRAARLEVGGAEHIRQEVEDARPALIENTLQDFRYGLRLLRRSPGFAAIAVLTIGLGIGANSAIFSVINAVVRKPLAYPQSDRLMFITSQFSRQNFDHFWVSAPEYVEFRQHSRAFSEVGAYRTGAVNVSEGDTPERVNATFMTASMWKVLGVQPELGSTFTAEQDLPNTEPVVLISHELWQRTFGADPTVVGRRIQIQGLPRTVLGIMPPGFDLHDAKTQVWVPMGLDPSNPGGRGSHFLYLVGRLAPGISVGQAQSDLRSMLKQWSTWAPAPGANGFTHSPNDSTHQMQLAPLQQEVVGSVKRALWVLQGAVALVLLVACANVANLLLARAEARHKEFAVRSAIGASRGRILRQFISEGIVLSTLGAVLGLLIAYGGLKALLASNPESIPRATEITLDPWVLGFTVAVAVVTGVVFGTAPLLHMSEKSVTIAIKEGGARTTSNAGRNRVRRGLVVGEMALAVMLVIGAGLLIKSFRNLTSVDPGFDPQNKITFGLVLPQAAYPDSQRRVQFFDDLTRKLEAIPGVQKVGAMQGLPPFRQLNANDVNFEGYTPTPGGTDPIPNVDYYNYTTQGYFDAMGIPIKDGRAFNATDAGGGPVVIINEALARRFYPKQNPIGKRLDPFLGQGPMFFTIIGIAKDVKQGGLEADAGTETYFFYDQLPRLAGFAPGQMNIVLRSSRPLGAIAPSLRRAVKEMDPALPIVQMRSMDDVIGQSITRQRFLSLLLGIFAVVALTLAAIGTYGVLSYMVTERQREIGIRMALGAGNNQVVGLVLGQGMAIAIAGILVGVLGAYGLSRLTASLLFGVSPSDPATYTTVAVVIAAVAVAACVVPIRKATRVDPLEAIRAD